MDEDILPFDSIFFPSLKSYFLSCVAADATASPDSPDTLIATNFSRKTPRLADNPNRISFQSDSELDNYYLMLFTSSILHLQ
jgi:hypothetical protein